MDSKKEYQVLIIGGHNSGKTHFGGQLLARLLCKEGEYKIMSPPESLTLYKEVIEKLYSGLSAGHTPISVNKQLSLLLENKKGQKINLTIPDYAGEQVQHIVEDRRTNQAWQEQIEKSDAWMLFIRPDEINPIEDITNRGLPELEELKKRKDGDSALETPKQTFFIELLQILLFNKGISLINKINAPKLTVVLTCWDKLTEAKSGTLPLEILKAKLPLFYTFLTSNWEKDSLNIIGLSSTGRTLDPGKQDMEFVEKGPENFGYFVQPDAKKEDDLTLIVSSLIEQ